ARLAHASTFRDRVSVSGTGQFRPMRIPGSRSTATRVVRGAICLSISSHFALRPNSKLVKPVALSAALAMLATGPPAQAANLHEHDRYSAGDLPQRQDMGIGRRQDDVGSECHQFRGVLMDSLGIAGRLPIVDLHIVADRPAKLGQLLQESRDVGVRIRILFLEIREDADAAHALRLLYISRERQGRRYSAEKGYEVAPSHFLPRRGKGIAR